MKREDVLLAVLAASNGRPYTPVQIQKTLFLIAMNLPKLFAKTSRYSFVPYDYGPFDAAVYRDSVDLSNKGLVEITREPDSKWKNYAASEDGLEEGQAILDRMTEERREYIKNISKWVRKQDFSQLVKAIYDNYPEMRANSIFQG